MADDNQDRRNPQHDNAVMRGIAENVTLRAWHQILTVVGLPVILGLCAWTLKTSVETSERVAVLETLPPRIERLEKMADAYAPYPLADARRLERDVNNLEGRVVSLERIVFP